MRVPNRVKMHDLKEIVQR